MSLIALAQAAAAAAAAAASKNSLNAELSYGDELYNVDEEGNSSISPVFVCAQQLPSSHREEDSSISPAKRYIEPISCLEGHGSASTMTKSICTEPIPSQENASNNLTSICSEQISSADPLNWSEQITVEERQFITKKIQAAYQRKTPSYESLLETCSAMEEEFVFQVAPSRLDYFKSGVQYEKKIVEKLFTNRQNASAPSPREVSNETDESSRGLKRAKTQH